MWEPLPSIVRRWELPTPYAPPENAVEGTVDYTTDWGVE